LIAQACYNKFSLIAKPNAVESVTFAESLALLF